MAWSRKALNLISALQRMSGLGVRPPWYSRRNSANTRSLYSAAKLTSSSSMPTTTATADASLVRARDLADLAVRVLGREVDVLEFDADHVGHRRRIHEVDVG